MPRPRPIVEDAAPSGLLGKEQEQTGWNANVEARRASIAARAGDGGGELHIDRLRTLLSARDRGADVRNAAYSRLSTALAVDKMRMDDELMMLPPNIQEAGEQAANAIHRREMGAHMLKIITAQAAAKLRKTPTDSGKDRSESAVTSELPLDQDVIEATRIMHHLESDASFWGVLARSWDTKRTALRATADLINSGFMSTASITEGRREEMAAARRAMNDRS